MTEKELITRIRSNILKKLDMPIKTSAQTLADRLGISKTYAWDIMKNKNFNPKLKTLLEFARVLEIDFLDLFKEA